MLVAYYRYKICHIAIACQQVEHNSKSNYSTDQSINNFWFNNDLSRRSECGLNHIF